MKEMIIKVPDESVAFVEEFVEKIGGDVSKIKAKTSAKSKKSETKKTRRPKPLDFFDTWHDIDLNPKTYRKKLCEKLQNFSCYRHHHQNIPWRQRETQNNCSYSG